MQHISLTSPGLDQEFKIANTCTTLTFANGSCLLMIVDKAVQSLFLGKYMYG